MDYWIFKESGIVGVLQYNNWSRETTATRRSFLLRIPNIISSANGNTSLLDHSFRGGQVLDEGWQHTNTLHQCRDPINIRSDVGSRRRKFFFFFKGLLVGPGPDIHRTDQIRYY